MTDSPSFHTPRSPSSPADMDAQTHASKKIKRSHAGDGTPAAKRHQPAANKLPPSPPRSRASSVEMKDAADLTFTSTKVDLSSVNDEIVEAVIVQLQNAGNRPHIVKELVPVLMQQLKIVQQYAPSRLCCILHVVPRRAFARAMICIVANDTNTTFSDPQIPPRSSPRDCPPT